MITAKELRDQLVGIPDHVLIVLQTDDEGNGYRYIRGLDFQAPDTAEASYFDGDDCLRREDLDAGHGDIEDYNHVAVVF